MDTSTLLVVFLLVTAATLASYALSHWSSIRGAIGLGWAATSIGTTMLLTAAAIVVLTFVFRGPLWRPDLGQSLDETAAAAEQTLSQRIKASPFSVTPTASASSPTASKPARATDRQHRTYGSTASIDNDAPQISKAASTSQTIERSSQSRSALHYADPWAATKCVSSGSVGLNPSVRWKIENGCDTPVVISYSGGSMILPAPAQRPVTLNEQTVDAGVSYIACFITAPEAIELIGAPLEERATPEWRERFESARANDSCLHQQN